MSSLKFCKSCLECTPVILIKSVRDGDRGDKRRKVESGKWKGESEEKKKSPPPGDLVYEIIKKPDAMGR